MTTFKVSKFDEPDGAGRSEQARKGAEVSGADDRKVPEMAHMQDVGYPKDAKHRNDVTGWIGWVLFAGIIMFTVGSINIIEGIVALVNDDYYLVDANRMIVDVDYTAWGWMLLTFGLLLVFAGYGVMVGQTWARVTGIILAVVNAVLNLLFVRAYPVWSIIVITLDVLVIYALAAHGREAKRLTS